MGDGFSGGVGSSRGRGGGALVQKRVGGVDSNVWICNSVECLNRSLWNY